MISIPETELLRMMADDGAREVSCYGEVLSDGVPVKKVSCSGTVDLDTTAEIQRTASLAFSEELDWLDVEIRAVEEVNGKAYPLGIFIPSSPTENENSSGRKSYPVECYDRTIRLKQSGLREPLLLKAGTPYLDAVQQIAAKAGAGDILVKDDGLFTLPSDRIFERGSSRLAIINTLLDEINYQPISCSADGTFIIEAFREEIPEQAGIAYNSTSCRALAPEYSSMLDAFHVPNVFFVTVSGLKQEGSFSSQYINDDPDSPFSTVRRGMEIVMELEPPSAIGSQEELDMWCRRKAMEMTDISETITFKTLTMPIHEAGDYISLDYKGHTGLYQETGWTIPLQAGSVMTHKARKVL